MPIDLNADLGEQRGDDAALMPFITSANIACGGHAGDAETMRRTVELALRSGVAIGAHPGYPDRATFGRSVQALPPADLAATIIEQLDALASVARQAGAVVFHVKPHGALYNQAARDPGIARVVAEAVRTYDPRLVLVGQAQSRLPDAGRQAGLRVAHEGFIDRTYEPDGSLRDRKLPGAVFADEEQALAQALSIARDGRAVAADGSSIALRADTLCLHGDTPGAVAFARHARAALEPLIPVLSLAHILGR